MAEWPELAARALKEDSRGDWTGDALALYGVLLDNESHLHERVWPRPGAAARRVRAKGSVPGSVLGLGGGLARALWDHLAWAGHTRGSPLTRASIAPGTKMYAYYVVHAAEACVSAAAEAEAAGAAAAATLTANGWHSRVA
jgi:hypothetical protein